MELATYLVLVLLMALTPSLCATKDPPPKEDFWQPDFPPNMVDPVQWLIDHKYLAEEKKDDQDAITSALVQAQANNGLKPNGMVDEGTQYLMENYVPMCASGHQEAHQHSRNKRYATLSRNIWKDMPVTISFTNYLQSSTISQQEQEDIAMECAKRWADVSSLSFTKAAYGQQGNIAIEFRPIDGPYNTVGVGLSATPFANPPSSYLRLDIDEQWVRNRPTYGQGVSMTWAMCHEMGHTLSLGHSSYEYAIMYASHINQDDTKLNQDDINGIQSLYGGPSSKPVQIQTRMEPPQRPYEPTYRYTPQTQSPPTYKPVPIRFTAAQATPFWKWSQYKQRQQALGRLRRRSNWF